MSGGLSTFSGLGRPDFLHAAQELLPPGLAWPRDPAATLSAVLGGLSDAVSAAHQVQVQLLEVESDPALTEELLAAWETDWGLPDPCTPLNPTVEQRRNALVAKIISRGGATPAYFIAIAAALGYTITITQFTAAKYGSARYGTPMYGPLWAYLWQVNAPATTVVPAIYGSSSYGQPYRVWGNAELECRLTNLKPAHTIVQFSYGP